jgi:site-specific recombinase XerC
LGTFFRWLIAEGIADKNPLVNVKSPRPEKKIIQPFSRGDIDSLLLQTSGDKFLNIRNRAIVFLLLNWLHGGEKMRRRISVEDIKKTTQIGMQTGDCPD